MQGSETVARRRFIRALRSAPLSLGVVQSLLPNAAQTLRGGHLQPWHVPAYSGKLLADILSCAIVAGPHPLPGYHNNPETGGRIGKVIAHVTDPA